MRKIRDKLSEKIFGNEWERLLDKAQRKGAQRFLLFWNRGLGDIALGLCQVIAEIHERRPQAEISVVTRPELAESFQLLPVRHVLVDPALTRGAVNGAAQAFKRLRLPLAHYDVVLARINPTKWFAQRPRLQPRLNWPVELDALSQRFDAYFENVPAHAILIGAHVQSETGAFYGYSKDWPIESWQALLAQVSGSAAPGSAMRFILFGHQSNLEFDPSICIDLRGKTTFLEMMALLKNRCDVLIAPDSGVLTMSYYLDATFPIDVISLWADPRQGILKQGVASPNSELRHHPLYGQDEQVAHITVDEVLNLLRTLLQQPGKNQPRL